jgi:hypothetical protein
VVLSVKSGAGMAGAKNMPDADGPFVDVELVGDDEERIGMATGMSSGGDEVKFE